MTNKKSSGDKKRYVVSGVTTLLIDGVRLEPGSEFEASLDQTFEEQMLMGGHLEVLIDQSQAADTRDALAASQDSVAPVSEADLPSKLGRKKSAE